MSPIRPSKHAVLIDTLPAALQGVAELRAAGRGDLADAMQHVADYAETNAKAELAAADKRPANARSIEVPAAFREHVLTVAKTEKMNISEVVRNNLTEFLDGTWMPPQPPPRAKRGTGSAEDKARIAVSVDQDLWDDVNDHGKDPEAVAARGYKLTAAQVAIAALEATFGSGKANAG